MKKSIFLRLTFMLILAFSVQMAYSQTYVYKCVAITKNGDPWWHYTMNDDYYCIQFNENSCTAWWWDKSKKEWTNQKVYKIKHQAGPDGMRVYTRRRPGGVIVYGREKWCEDILEFEAGLNTFTSSTVYDGGNEEELIFTYQRTE